MNTDFEAWDHATLARFARDVYEENKRLRSNVRAALDAFRKQVVQTAPQAQPGQQK